MRRIALALLALLLLRADMYPDASNAKLPQARANLGAGNPVSIKDHGAKGDAITAPDGVMSAGSATFTSTLANFTAADVGKKIQVDGAAGVWLPPLRTTISAVTDAHTVSLAAPATKATPRRWLSAAFVSAPRATGSYVPGDLLTVIGGTYTTQAVLRVVSTTVTASAIVAGGVNGRDGACRVQGTTGNGTLLQRDVTVSGGAITALGSFWGASHYFTNPTSLAAEPVSNAPGFTCAPTGATMSLTMGVEQVVPQTRGDYDPVALPADPFPTGAGSISGATGATFTHGGVPWGTFANTGLFVYGTDDSQALKDSIDTAAASFTAGKPAYVFIPTGNYLIDAVSTPLMWSGLGIVGEGAYKTNIIIGANYIGDLFAWDEAWAGDAGGGHLNGTVGMVSNLKTGPKAIGFGVWGNRAAATQQNVLMFYDRSDQVLVDDVDINYVTGHCMKSGVRKLPDYPASMRESQIGHMRCFVAGGPGIAAIEFLTEGSGDATDEIHIEEINIYANQGDGLLFRNASPTGDPMRNIYINKLRIEGQQWGEGGDLLRFGDPAMSGPITGVFINQLQLTTPYPNKASLRLTGPGDIYFLSVASGQITSGLPMGYGVVLERGRNLSFHFSDIYSWNTNFVMGPGVGPVSLDGDGREPLWTYSLAIPMQLSTPVRKLGVPNPNTQMQPAIMPVIPDGTAIGGNARGSGAVDLQTGRYLPTEVASGLQAVIGGGIGNAATGSGAIVAGGYYNSAAGFGTAIPGGARATDRGSAGGMYYSSSGCQAFAIQGTCQRSWHVLAAMPNTAAAVRLTSDSAAPASTGINCVPIPNGSSYQTAVRATARNWGTNENASWDAIQGMLVRKNGFPTAYLGGAGGAQSQTTAGAFGTLAVAADATNNCLALTYTPPAGNTDSIHIVATVDVAEVQ